MDDSKQYSVVVLPKEAWENVIQTLKDLKTKVESLTQKDDDWLDSKTVQDMLGISSRQFQKYRDERRISFSQFERKIYVKRSDLNDFLERNRIKSRYGNNCKDETLQTKHE